MPDSPTFYYCTYLPSKHDTVHKDIHTKILLPRDRAPLIASFLLLCYH